MKKKKRTTKRSVTTGDFRCIKRIWYIELHQPEGIYEEMAILCCYKKPWGPVKTLSILNDPLEKIDGRNFHIQSILIMVRERKIYQYCLNVSFFFRKRQGNAFSVT